MLLATAASEAKVVVGKEFNASDDNCLSILAKISKASLTPWLSPFAIHSLTRFVANPWDVLNSF